MRQRTLSLSPASAFVLGLAIFAALWTAIRLAGDDAGGSLSPVFEQTTLKTALVVVSVLWMLTDSRGLAAFGFTPARGMRWRRVLGSGALLGAVTTLLVLTTPAEGMAKVLGSFSLLQIVTVIWIWSSFTEEVFARGLVQTWIPDRGKLDLPFVGERWSAPVVASALLFGTMHFSLWFQGVDALTTAIIVTATTCLGLLAGGYRERSGSLLPAFLTHLAFNVGGFAAGVVWAVAHIVLNRPI